MHIDANIILTGSASNKDKGGSIYTFFPGISLADKNFATPGNF